MMPIQSIEGPVAPGDGESSRQKPKTLLCQYCDKRFRRLEHLQRHIRTHTKEKPFRCACGKTFGRRDLLVRHEKLVHFNENKAANHAAETMASMAPAVTSSTQRSPPNHVQQTSNVIDPDLLQATSYSNAMDSISIKSPDIMMHHRTPGCSLDLLSDAANHLASNDNRLAPIMSDMKHENRISVDMNGHQANMHFDNRVQEDPALRNPTFQPGGTPGALEDYNLFLDDFGLSSHYFLPSNIDQEIPSSIWSRDPPPSNPIDPRMNRDGQDEHNSFSRFASRLPSMQPEYRDSPDSRAHDAFRPSPPWKISATDHNLIQNKTNEFLSVLQKGFVLPSRHTLSRFLEGYVNGFHEHLPFLHIPTLSAVNCAPELLLALAAVGAQYRFENHRGNGLWYASRAVALEQIRRRSSHDVSEILSPPSTYRSESTGLSPTSTARNSSMHGIGDTMMTDIDENCLKTPQAKLETIQALILLMAMGTWAPRALLREALCLQSCIALLVREQGLSVIEPRHEDLTWEEWIQSEGEKRTKLIAYCFFSLHCIAYDMPPLLLTAEIKMTLPYSAKEWKAENARQWRELRRTTHQAEITFHDALARLFSKGPPNPNDPPLSSLGNYVLIHALVQQIFLVRQTSSRSSPETANNSLKPVDIDELGQALRSWQSGWEQTPESSLDPSSPNGPVAFNSTALLRLAYIRLHSDLGPCRKLDTRDPVRIAAAFKDSPPLIRSARLGRAVLQSAHALSIPVRIGIAFVARTQTFSWSIQHSLCNLECAFLLSKWLETIAISPMDLVPDERNLLEMVRSMLDETEFAVSFSSSDGHVIDERVKIRQLGAAVVRLWAETFKGTHIFEIVKVIGSSLEIYAELLEKATAGDSLM